MRFIAVLGGFFTFISTLLDIFISRRCYTEKKAQMLRRFFCVTSAKMHLRNICVKNVQ